MVNLPETILTKGVGIIPFRIQCLGLSKSCWPPPRIPTYPLKLFLLPENDLGTSLFKILPTVARRHGVGIPGGKEALLLSPSGPDLGLLERFPTTN